MVEVKLGSEVEEEVRYLASRERTTTDAEPLCLSGFGGACVYA